MKLSQIDSYLKALDEIFEATSYKVQCRLIDQLIKSSKYGKPKNLGTKKNAGR